ncbi:hypothetical protein T492DRAFT_1054573 [Pavlovales sp. CCMP2436]|nr:hypothetical protein T492DRAFT_1054573 [Pavlovales sp. CCMP2436]
MGEPWAPPEVTAFARAWDPEAEPDAPNARELQRPGTANASPTSTMSPGDPLRGGVSGGAGGALTERLYSQAAELRARREALHVARKAEQQAEEDARPRPAPTPKEQRALTQALANNFWVSTAAEAAGGSSLASIGAQDFEWRGSREPRNPEDRRRSSRNPGSSAAALVGSGSPAAGAGGRRRGFPQGAEAGWSQEWAPGRSGLNLAQPGSICAPAGFEEEPVSLLPTVHDGGEEELEGEGKGASAYASALAALPVEARLARYAELVERRKSRARAAAHMDARKVFFSFLFRDLKCKLDTANGCQLQRHSISTGYTITRCAHALFDGIPHMKDPVSNIRCAAAQSEIPSKRLGGTLRNFIKMREIKYTQQAMGDAALRPAQLPGQSDASLNPDQ